MPMDAYGKRYCEIKFVHDDRPDINRRAQEIVLVGSDGIARNVKEAQIPKKLIFLPPRKKDDRSLVEILLDEPLGQRPSTPVVTDGPGWPTNRDLLHMAVPLVALAALRFIASIAVAHP